MVLKRRIVEVALKNKGFPEKTWDHKFFIYYTQDGMKTPVRTKISHGSGNRDIGPELVKRMARQCRLTAEDFCKRLISCAMVRRFSLAGANPAQQLRLRLVAARAVYGGNDMD